MGSDNQFPAVCPRCGEAVVPAPPGQPGPKLRDLPQPPGYTPVWHLTHKRQSGKGCGAYLGVPLGHEDSGAGNPRAAGVAVESVRPGRCLR